MFLHIFFSKQLKLIRKKTNFITTLLIKSSYSLNEEYSRVFEIEIKYYLKFWTRCTWIVAVTIIYNKK